MISVDTKKKELVGDFKNAGRAWRPKGSPEEVRVHDFLIKELGRAVPYGVYDLATNAGWVGVGQDHDTAAFAVQTIRRWWQEIGQSRYRAAPRLTITADGGGSNGVRVRLWKRELQKLCDETGLAITVHHLPPGNEQVERDRAPAPPFSDLTYRTTPRPAYPSPLQPPTPPPPPPSPPSPPPPPPSSPPPPPPPLPPPSSLPPPPPTPPFSVPPMQT